MSSSHYMHIAHIGGGGGGALVQIVASTLEE